MPLTRWPQLIALAISAAILLLPNRALAISTASLRATTQARGLEPPTKPSRRVSSIHAQRAPAAARASMNLEETAGAQAKPSTCEWRQPPNLYDFRARAWSTELGAFLQPDEYGFLTAGGTP